MSLIADALAKSRGKQVASSSEEPPASVGAPVDMSPSATSTPGRPLPKPALMGGAVALAVVLGGVAWFVLGGKNESPPPTKPPVATKAAVPSPKVPAPVQSPAPVQPSTAPMPTLAKEKATPVTSSPVVAETPETEPAVPPEDVARAVRQLAITAVTAGADARAIIGRRVYHAGDEVIPGVVLVEIREGQLVFRDRTGNTYQRRF